MSEFISLKVRSAVAETIFIRASAITAFYGEAGSEFSVVRVDGQNFYVSDSPVEIATKLKGIRK